MAVAGGGYAAIFEGLAHRAGREPVVLGKDCVKAPYATKAAALCHLADGPAGIGQPLFGVQQTPRLQVLQGRDMQVLFHQAAQMALANA